MTNIDTSLEAVGLSAREVQLYELLIDRSRASLGELVASTSLSQRQVREALQTLEEKALISRSAGTPRRYVPAPPEAVVDILIRRRQEEIERARLALVRLGERFRAASPRQSSPEVAEVIAGGDAVRAREVQLLSSATQEILGFAKPPLTSPDESWTRRKLDLLNGGVRGRVVYSRQALEVPGMVSFIEALATAGEEARIVDTLPTRLVIVDRRLAYLPLRLEEVATDYEYLLVHESSLLDSLILLFETVWDRASPFATADAGYVAADQDQPALSPSERRLLALLGAGLKDVAIAAQLGVGARTIERHVAAIMAELGTHTRFQAGVEACRHGWL